MRVIRQIMKERVSEKAESDILLKGIDEVKKIAQDFDIDDINFIKPGIGEATRVLLRRVPWKVLVAEKNKDARELRHLIRLAAEKNVPVEYYPLKNYKCCGIIKHLSDV